MSREIVSQNCLLRTSDGNPQNTYTYDGQHRRVSKKTFVGNRLTTSTHFIHDGWNVIEEWTTDLQSPTTTLAKTHTWGIDVSGTLQDAGGVGGLLLTEETGSQATTAYHFHYDGNGNVTEITDLTGTPAASYRYDAFGNTLVATGSYAEENKYRFSTKPLDAEITTAPLYYYGYRYYDPVTGRWPSRDPIGEEGGINLYGFTDNSPLDRWDYLGQAWYDDIVDYFKEIPDATRECYGDTARDIILSISIVPYEEVATGDVKAIAAGALLNRVPGAKCGIKGAKKLGAAFKKSDGKCYQKVEVEVKKPKKKHPKDEKCKNGTWLVGGCGLNHNPDCRNVVSDYAVGPTKLAALQASKATIPKHCWKKGRSVHHCAVFVCKGRKWQRVSR